MPHFIHERPNRCAYCFLPTTRAYVTKCGVSFRVCSDACEHAIKLRLDGYEEDVIRWAWEARPREERRPTKQAPMSEVRIKAESSVIDHTEQAASVETCAPGQRKSA